MRLFYLSPNKPEGIPWWERNLFWGPLALGIAIVLTVVGAMKHDLRWLLLGALPCFLLSAWPVAMRLSSLWVRCLSMAITALIIFAALFGLNKWLSSASTVAKPIEYIRSDTIAKLDGFARKSDWYGLANTLYVLDLDHNQELQDVDLYYSGLLYSHVRPGLDPEHFLSQVPAGSDLFERAQEARLYNYSLHPTVEFRTTIMNSLDRAGLRDPVYYRLRLDISPIPTFNEIATLYDEFVARYNPVFDFVQMSPISHFTIPVGASIDLNDAREVPGTVLLFLFQQLKAAKNECLKERERDILGRYDLFLKDFDDYHSVVAQAFLQLNVVGIKRAIEQIRRVADRKCTVR